jgi:iron complex transport system substrate-binding protein
MKLKDLMPIIVSAVIITAVVFVAISFADTKTTMVDDAKRSVKIPVSPQRIIVLNSSNMEMLYAVGGNAVGRPESTGMPPALLNKVKSLPSVGETPNPSVEKIVSLNPDLVIGVNVAFHHQIIPPLEKAGIPILLMSINSYDDILNKLRIYGTITGNKEKAEAVVKGIEKRVAEIRNNIKRMPQNKPPKVAILWGSTQSFNMALPSSFVGNIVEILDGDNIAKDIKPLNTMPQYAPLSPEYVMSKDPDVMLVITHGDDDKVKEKFKREITQHPAWKELRAVKEGRLYLLPYDLFGVNPAIRVADAVAHIARLMYPEAFK